MSLYKTSQKINLELFKMYSKYDSDMRKTFKNKKDISFYINKFKNIIEESNIFNILDDYKNEDMYNYYYKTNRNMIHYYCKELEKAYYYILYKKIEDELNENKKLNKIYSINYYTNKIKQDLENSNMKNYYCEKLEKKYKLFGLKENILVI